MPEILNSPLLWGIVVLVAVFAYFAGSRFGASAPQVPPQPPVKRTVGAPAGGMVNWGV